MKKLLFWIDYIFQLILLAALFVYILDKLFHFLPN